MNKIHIFNVWVTYFMWNIKWYLWNSTQNILPIFWKKLFLQNVEFLRALRFKSRDTFLRCPEAETKWPTFRWGQFQRIFFNKNVWIAIKISLKFVPKGPMNKIPAMIQIMAWRRSGDKPSSYATLISLPTHICVTRPQWVNTNIHIVNCDYQYLVISVLCNPYVITKSLLLSIVSPLCVVF